MFDMRPEGKKIDNSYSHERGISLLNSLSRKLFVPVRGKSWPRFKPKMVLISPGIIHLRIF